MAEKVIKLNEEVKNAAKQFEAVCDSYGVTMEEALHLYLQKTVTITCADDAFRKRAKTFVRDCFSIVENNFDYHQKLCVEILCIMHECKTCPNRDFLCQNLSKKSGIKQHSLSKDIEASLGYLRSVYSLREKKSSNATLLEPARWVEAKGFAYRKSKKI